MRGHPSDTPLKETDGQTVVTQATRVIKATVIGLGRQAGARPVPRQTPRVYGAGEGTKGAGKGTSYSCLC